MVGLGVLALIVFAIVSYIRNCNFDARFKFGQQIATHLALNETFEESYLGGFGFDEALPNEPLRKAIEGRFDRGVESRLAFHLAETLPNWVLKAGANDIASGEFNLEGSYGKYIGEQIDVFATKRSSQLSDLLNRDVALKPHPDRRRRRRR